MRQRVIVVGSSGGIGRAVVRRCRADGSRVVGWDVAADRADEDALEVDATDPTAAARAAAESLERLGSLDAVVFAAGTVGRGWLHQTDLAEWRRVIDTNLTAAFVVLHSLVPHMLSAGGSVITIGSTASAVITGGGTSASYAASKAGLLQLTRQVAVDYAAHGILANCVCPGWIDTPLNHNSSVAAGPAWTNERLPRNDFPAPLPGPGSVDQVAGVVRFLLSDDASHITGTALMVDGGYTAI